MAVMNRANCPKGLEEGINTFFGMEYKQHPEEWRGCFDIESSKKAWEEDVIMTGFGAAQVKDEGGTIAYDMGQEGWSSRYNHETIALAFAITEENIEDQLYVKMSQKYGRALARAMQHTKEIKGASIFNNGYSASYLGGDGKALLATDHPLIGGGVGSNKLATPADFGETSLENIMIQIRKAVDDRNVPIALRPTGLILPPELEWDAIRLLKSDYRVGTSDNDINAINSKGVFREPKIITRLTDADAWFVKTDANDGLKHMNRVAIQRGTEGDFETGNMRYKSRERYSFGWTDWRSTYGSEGTP